MKLDRKYWTGNFVTRLDSNQIFVFGSNPAGRHGSGAAKAAINFGAWYGEGRGLYGQTYGIVTKNLNRNYKEEKTGILYSKVGMRSVSPEQIKENIREMYELAYSMPEKEFLIIYKNELDHKGNYKKSLNGYTSIEMLDMFLEKMNVPDNIVFHDSFKSLIESKFNKKLNIEFDSQNYSTFSQWYPSKFQYKERQFVSVGQFILYSKAKLFKNEDIAEKILLLSNSYLGKNFISGELDSLDILNNQSNFKTWNDMIKYIKKCDFEIKNYNEDLWLQKRTSIIYVGNREKYNQNIFIKNELLSSEKIIINDPIDYDNLYTNNFVAQILETLKKKFNNIELKKNLKKNRNNLI